MAENIITVPEPCGTVKRFNKCIDEVSKGIGQNISEKNFQSSKKKKRFITDKAPPRRKAIYYSTLKNKRKRQR